MALGSKMPDKTILKNVDQKLARRGTGSNRITATVSNGSVTLTGAIAYEHERRPILRNASSVPGVRRVIDQLRVVQKNRSGE